MMSMFQESHVGVVFGPVSGVAGHPDFLHGSHTFVTAGCDICSHEIFLFRLHMLYLVSPTTPCLVNATAVKRNQER